MVRARYAELSDATRDIYEGFAAGVNRYIALHPAEFPAGFATRFTGYDVAARDVATASSGSVRRFLTRIAPEAARSLRADTSAAPPAEANSDVIEEGSNAWAFAPSRTKSGKAILVRNPHLNWNAGYYEAHLTVKGDVDFYGDFRIGGPFGVIGGFNRDLGWATTNNAPDLDEIYILRAAAEGDNRAGEQFLRMMRAKSLAEWKDAMRMRARVTSSFTYADRTGNILYVWNASIPSLPHASGGDTLAIPARRTADVWTRYVPFDSLPQVLNPKGGYVRNENDAPYHTNLRQVLDRARYPANFPEPSLRLRSQHSLSLIDNDRKLSLEEIVALKHSYRMLLADRVMDELLSAIATVPLTTQDSQALATLRAWDRTSAPASRGGVLFETWWRRYAEGTDADTMFAQPWNVAAPASTPRGLRNPSRAAQSFTWAVAQATRRFGDASIAWGDVHRVRRGTVDVPVGGCSGVLGC